MLDEKSESSLPAKSKSELCCTAPTQEKALMVFWSGFKSHVVFQKNKDR